MTQVAPTDQPARSATLGDGRPGAGGRATGQGLLTATDLRRAVQCVILAAVLCLMTGPEGNSSSAVSGITGSFNNARVFWFVGLAAVGWLLMTGWSRFGQPARQLSERAVSPVRTVWPLWFVRYPTFLVLLGAAIVVPLFFNLYWQSVLVQQIGVYVLLAIGLNVVVGYAGLLDLGFVAFYAIGAYSAAYWSGALPVQPPTHFNMFYIVPLAMTAAMVAGVLLGSITLRLRGDYLAIVTLGFGEIIQIVATNLYSVTGGSQGTTGQIPHFRIDILGIHYAWGLANLPYYYLLLGFVVVILVMFTMLERSRVGRAWAAIREDEVAAESSGINVFKYKVMAFAIGASTSGFAGVMTASQVMFIDPGSFTFQFSILILVLVIFGGMGSLPGAVIGAAVLRAVPFFLDEHPLFGYQDQDLYMYIGAILVAMMIFRPEGIIPSRRRKREIGLVGHGIGSADAMTEPAGEVM
jgi:branched-chain amino acid transport system permease protein